MTQVDRRSALAIGLAAASAAMVKPAAAQTTDYKDTTVAPGVVNRVYGEGPSIIPGFKTVSLRDIIIQPGSNTPENQVMMNAMICHITEGELRVVQDGKTGLLYPPGDVNALANACHRLLGNPRLRQTIGRAAAKRVHTHYTWDRNASRAVQLARSLMAARRKRAKDGTTP